MAQNHLLSLLDKLQEKYSIQDREYKEIAQAIDGNNKPLDVSEANMVKMTYDLYECGVERDDEEFYPTLDFTKKCTCIWNVVEDKTSWHVYGNKIYMGLFNRCDIYKSELKLIIKEMEREKSVVSMTNLRNRRICIRPISVEIIS
jgi:hypothetical protein